jgi:hypothetical protein
LQITDVDSVFCDAFLVVKAADEGLALLCNRGGNDWLGQCRKLGVAPCFHFGAGLEETSVVGGGDGREFRNDTRVELDRRVGLERLRGNQNKALGLRDVGER